MLMGIFRKSAQVIILTKDIVPTENELGQLAIDNILCISKTRPIILQSKFKSAQDYNTQGGWGYTESITNYKGDKFNIYVTWRRRRIHVPRNIM